MITRTTLMEEDDPLGPNDPPGPHVLVMSPDAFSSVPLPAAGALNVGRSSKCAIRIEDPLASREHARLHVDVVEGSLSLRIEDLDSANGTRVRNLVIAPGELATFVPGDAITIGSTVLMVQQTRPTVGPRRLWSHAYFESRLTDECLRAGASGRTFAMARVRLTGSAAPWTRVLPILVRTIPLPHLFAAYGPVDYEILFLETEPNEVARLVEQLAGELRTSGVDARHGIAWYPRDGRSTDALLARANALLRTSDAGGKNGAAGDAAASGAGMDRLRNLAKKAAASNISVLILGETGVGKDVLAREIHRLSPRTGPFVALNCAGLAETLIETELFGHERGAFTGAARAKVGLLEAGNGGTIFLDEIGEMPLSLQPRLLRAIEAREVLPVGALKPRPIDVRFLAATNRDLEAEVVKGTFRRDLYFRLNTLTLPIPPLRDRTDEIPALVETFIEDACRESGRTPPTLTDEAMHYIQSYSWPGNIRELKNVIERALVLCDSDEIAAQYLPLDKMGGGSAQTQGSEESGPGLPRAADGDRITPPNPASLPVLDDPEKVAERQRILDALAKHAGNQTRAAESLGMPRRTFITKLDAYGIARPQKNRNSRS